MNEACRNGDMKLTGRKRIGRCPQGECIRDLLDQVVQDELELAAKAWHLARYVQEHQGKVLEYKGSRVEIKFPDGFDAGRFMQQAHHFVGLDSEQRQAFLNQYSALENATGFITARPLNSTRRSINFRDNLRTPAFRHLIDLFILVLILVPVTVISVSMLHIAPEMLEVQILFAFSAAGLGACVYLLRVTQMHLKMRSFEIERISGHYVRLMVGLVAGGSIALFPELMSSYAHAADADSSILQQSSTGLLAFVLGRSITTRWRL